MSPAADNECPYTKNGVKIPAEKMLTECFYFSNMAPQYHSLNAGDWKTVEVWERDMALKYDSVHIWCGNIGEIKKIGSVSVPKECWKLVYIKKFNYNI